MAWVRRYKHYGVSLAFAALALQIVLAFGHFHLDQTVRASMAAVAASVSGKTVAQGLMQAPAQNQPADDDAYCPICASIYLASTSFVPLPPQLPLPAAFAPITHSYAAVIGVATPRCAGFQSRAPPTV